MKWVELVLLSQTGLISFFHRVFLFRSNAIACVHAEMFWDAHLFCFPFSKILHTALAVPLDLASPRQYRDSGNAQANRLSSKQSASWLTQFEWADQVLMCHINIVSTHDTPLHSTPLTHSSLALQIGFRLLKSFVYRPNFTRWSSSSTFHLHGPNASNVFILCCRRLRDWYCGSSQQSMVGHYEVAQEMH